MERPARRKIDEIAENAASLAESIVKEATADRIASEFATRERIEKMRAEYGRKLYEEVDRMRRASERKSDITAASEMEKVHTESLSVLKEKFISMVKNSDDSKKKEWATMLIEGAISDIGVGILHVRKEDEEVASSVSGFEIVSDLRASGGIIAESGDGTVLLDYTLESLAECYWNSTAGCILELLFG